MKISEADKIRRLRTPERLVDTDWYDVRLAPFEIYGLYRPEDGAPFRRMEDSAAESVSDGVKLLNSHTTGGRVRFSTDSPFISVKVTWESENSLWYMPTSATSGFDLYYDTDAASVYAGTFFIPSDAAEGYTSSLDLRKNVYPGMVDYTVDFPLFNSVSTLHVGVAAGSAVGFGKPVKDAAPIVYYGSSITHGLCASRPGNSYPGFIFRRNNVDFINLGFAANARGETAMAEYIAGLDMSVFVLDYDHNAHTPEDLNRTHYPFYRVIRDKNPDLPIIMVSHPATCEWKDEDRRRRYSIIEGNFRRAQAEGDKNVYYVDGSAILGDEGFECTVDGVHPTDLGFYRMAAVIGSVIDGILGKM